MRAVDKLAEDYTVSAAERDPVLATLVGIPGHDDAVTDLSTEGYTERAELDRVTVGRLERIEPTDDRERVAREAMIERLRVAVELFDSGHPLSDVNVVASALHSLRETFDLMPIGDRAAASTIAARMGGVPLALSQWRQTLLTAARRGNVASRKQILEVAAQCERWADPNGDNVFGALAERAGVDLAEPAGQRLVDAANQASAAVDATGGFLRSQLAALGRTDPAAGRDRYQVLSRYFLGSTIDIDETYAWAFEELAAIRRDMVETAQRVVPGGSIEEAVSVLDSDPSMRIDSPRAFQRWMQDLTDQTIAELDGRHFDISGPLRQLTCEIAPTSDGSIYYTTPSEDFSRPGRMWWSFPAGVSSVSTWREVTTVYHEGVPGHHLQIGTAITNHDQLNRWQRLLSWASGHGEGWALYAERLMDELGHFQEPGPRMGMLDAQSMRAARVIIDLGLHCRLPIPRDNPLGLPPGKYWTEELVWSFLRAHARMPVEMLRFELNRYVGWPGQASSYKIGERIWLAARQAARQRHGEAFDLRVFHRDALRLGSLGLDSLVSALARL